MITFLRLLFSKPKPIPVVVKGYDPKDYPSSVVGAVRIQPRSCITINWTEDVRYSLKSKWPVSIIDKSGVSITEDWTITMTSKQDSKNETIN